MRKKIYLLILVIITALILSACNNGEKDTEPKPDNEEQSSENTKNDKNENTTDTTQEPDVETEEITVEPIPTDVEGLASQTPGPLGNVKNLWEMEQEVKKHMEKIGTMSKNPTEREYEKYLRYIYSLVKEDYASPKDMIKKWKFASFGNPDLPDARYHFKENYNIEIILDSSGSMANTFNGKTRMEIAKETIHAFLSQVPKEANVSLRVYGHKGTGSEADKAMSCSAIEQVYGFSKYNKADFQEALNKFEPSGWTPIAAALKQSKEAMKKYDAKNNTNLIYLVSDGIGTCGGDPVKVAKSFADSNAKPIINIIGFQADAAAQKQLEEIARVTDGIFASAKNGEELQEEFDRAEEVLEAWKDWKENAERDLDAMEVDNSFDILHLHNEWNSTTLSTKNNMNRLANIAENLGFFTLDQKEVLEDGIEKVMEEIEIIGDKLRKDLEELSEKNIEEARKLVEEKYNSQTQN